LSSKIKNIVVTRSKEQSQNDFTELESLGINVIYFPAIKIEESERIIDLKILLSKNSRFDYIIFPSFNSAKYFLVALNETYYDINLIRLKIAVGSKTKAYCEKHKIHIDYVPEEYSAEGVIKYLSENDLEGKKILIPKSEIGRRDLENYLRERKSEVFSIPVYKNELPNEDELKNIIDEVNESEIDLFLFTSPSNYENFVTLMNIEYEADYFSNSRIIAIGNSTKKVIEENGVEVFSVPNEFTIEGMVNEVKKINDLFVVKS
jgi:uroporphyrinogen-III synthase